MPEHLSLDDYVERFERAYFHYLFCYCEGMHDGEMETTHSGEAHANLRAEDRRLVRDDCSAYITQHWSDLQGWDPRESGSAFFHWRNEMHWPFIDGTRPEMARLRRQARQFSHQTWIWDRQRRTIRPPRSDQGVD